MLELCNMMNIVSVWGKLCCQHSRRRKPTVGVFALFNRQLPLAARKITCLRGCLAAAVLFATAAVLAGSRPTVLYAAGEGLLSFTVLDDKTHEPIACRMHLVGPGKRPRKAEPMPFWNDHFVFPGKITLKLPVGKYTFQLQRAGVSHPRRLLQHGPFCRRLEGSHLAAVRRSGGRGLV